MDSKLLNRAGEEDELEKLVCISLTENSVLDEKILDVYHWFVVLFY